MVLRAKRTTFAAMALSGMLVVTFRDSNLEYLFSASAALTLLLIIFFTVMIIGNGASSISISGYTGAVALLILGSFIIALISGIRSDYIALSLQRSLLIFPPTLVFFVAISAARDPFSLFLSSAKFLIMVVVAVSFLGILLYLLGSGGSAGGSHRSQFIQLGPFKLSQIAMGVPPITRTGGLLGNPNTLARWIVAVFPFLFLMRKLGHMRKRTFYIYSTILLAGILITLSRTGIALLLGTWLIYIVLSRKSSIARTGYSLAAIMCTIAGILFIVSIDSNIERLSFDLNDRDVIWSLLLKSISESPLLGVGFGVSSEAIIDERGYFFSKSYSAHNFYLETISEIGIFGALMVFAIPIVLLVKSTSIWWKDSKWQNVRFTSASVLSYLLISVFYAVFEVGILRFSPVNFWFFFIAACICNKRFWAAIPRAKAHGASSTPSEPKNEKW